MNNDSAGSSADYRGVPGHSVLVLPNPSVGTRIGRHLLSGTVLFPWRETMKTRSMLLTVLLCLVAGAMSFASPQMGTWKLNEAKSKIPAGAPKNTTVVYEMVGDNVKVTVDGVDAAGKPAHNEWTGMFDGKDYPLVGDSSADTRAYKKINDHTLELTNKKEGKVTATGKVVVSADGKTRTVTVKATDASGNKVEYTAVYDKQ
jgi:hypothetical protein